MSYEQRVRDKHLENHDILYDAAWNDALDEVAPIAAEADRRIAELEAEVERLKDAAMHWASCNVGMSTSDLNCLYEIRRILDPDKPERKMQAEVVEAVRQLQAVVDKLPLTADGVRVVPGMKVWRYDDGVLVAWMSDLVARRWASEVNPASCYSTPEAAEAAREAAGEEVGGES